MTGNAPVPLRIDIVSDVVCPWCYIGQNRLAAAIETVPQLRAEIRWRPYQLDPTIPPEGYDRRQYMEAKFGDKERLKAAHQQVEAAGRSAGIDFRLDRIAVSPNTLDAHRVIRWAASAGPGAQSRLARRLFELYFEEGQNVSDHAVLVAAASEAGMDAAVVEALLKTDSDREAVREEIETARRMGITGVPCFLIEGKYAVVGAQDPAVLADALAKVAAAKARGELEPAGSG